MIPPLLVFVKGDWNNMNTETHGGTAIDTAPSVDKQRAYSDLIAYFEMKVAPTLGTQQRRNQLSTLALFLDHLGLSDRNEIGPELADRFELSLASFLDANKHADKARGTLNNYKSHLRGWKKTWDALAALEIQRQFNTFHESFQYYFELAKEKDPTLLLSGLSKTANVHLSTLFQFTRNVAQPKLSSRPAIERLEVILDTPRGALSAFVKNTTRSVYSDGMSKRNTTEYARRLTALKAKPYRLSEQEISIGLAKELKQFLLYKTETIVMPLKRNQPWRLQPVEKYSGPRWHLQHCSPDGERFAATGQKAFNSYVMYFGALKELKYEPAKFSFVFMADFSLIKEVVEYMTRRLGCFTTSLEQCLQISQSVLFPEFGYIRQHPEFAGKLPTPVDPAKWSEWCDQQFSLLRQFFASLKKKSEIKRTRNPHAIIKEYLDRDHPISILFELVANISQYLEDHPLMLKQSRIALERDLFLVRLLQLQPMRIKMFRDMSYFEDGSGNLYKRSNGCWAIQFKPGDFKNERGAAQKEYDVPLPEYMWADVERYLREIRPKFNDPRPLVFVANSSPSKVTDKNTNFLANAFQLRTRQFLDNCKGFGPHCARYLVGTDYIKNNPNGFQVAADVLHDKLETVLEHYVHLKAADGHKFYQAWLSKVRLDWSASRESSGEHKVPQAYNGNYSVRSAAAGGAS